MSDQHEYQHQQSLQLPLSRQTSNSHLSRSETTNQLLLPRTKPLPSFPLPLLLDLHFESPPRQSQQPRLEPSLPPPTHRLLRVSSINTRDRRLRRSSTGLSTDPSRTETDTLSSRRTDQDQDPTSPLRCRFFQERWTSDLVEQITSSTRTTLPTWSRPRNRTTLPPPSLKQLPLSLLLPLPLLQQLLAPSSQLLLPLQSRSRTTSPPEEATTKTTESRRSRDQELSTPSILDLNSSSRTPM